MLLNASLFPWLSWGFARYTREVILPETKMTAYRDPAAANTFALVFRDAGKNSKLIAEVVVASFEPLR